MGDREHFRMRINFYMRAGLWAVISNTIQVGNKGNKDRNVAEVTEIAKSGWAKVA